MKKFFLLFLVAAIAVNSFAQRALLHEPSLTQGFILCNTQDFPNAYYWKIQVFDRVYTDHDKFTQKEVYNTKLIDVNFLRLNDKYFDSDSVTYALVVTGYDRSDVELVSGDYVISYAQVPGPSDYINNYFEWYCVADNYAYQIYASMKQVNGEISGSGYLGLEDYHYNEDDPYRPLDKYVYFTTNELIDYCDDYSTQFYNYYNVSCNNLIGNGPFSSNAIKLYNIGAEDQYYGAYGQLVYGNIIYGVLKTRGPWKDHTVTTNELIGPIDQSWTLGQSINAMNLYGDPGFEWYNMSDLECISMDETTNNDPPDMEPYDEYEDCFEEMNGADWVDDADFFDIISSIDDCMNGVDDDDWPWWPNNIDYVSVGCISAVDAKTYWIYRDSLIDENNNVITAPSFTLDKGLYAIRYYFSDKSTYLNVVELKNKVSNSVDISDFFDAVIYPVPIIDNSFTIEMTSQLKTNLKYELFDENGKILYHSEYTIPSEKPVTVKVSVKEIPKGVLLNVFTFSDGSTYTLTTFK